MRRKHISGVPAKSLHCRGKRSDIAAISWGALAAARDAQRRVGKTYAVTGAIRLDRLSHSALQALHVRYGERGLGLFDRRRHVADDLPVQVRRVDLEHDFHRLNLELAESRL